MNSRDAAHLAQPSAQGISLYGSRFVRVPDAQPVSRSIADGTQFAFASSLSLVEFSARPSEASHGCGPAVYRIATVRFPVINRPRVSRGPTNLMQERCAT